MSSQIIFYDQGYDFSDSYILVKGTITWIAGNTFIFKNCTPFISCVTCIKKSWVDESSIYDLNMVMYYLIEYSDKYSKNTWKFIPIA